jgi:hypothetical protein
MPLSYQDCRVLFVCDGRSYTRAQQSLQTRGRGSSEREGNGESERGSRCELRTVLAAGVTRRGVSRGVSKNKDPNVSRGCGGQEPVQVLKYWYWYRSGEP